MFRTTSDAQRRQAKTFKEYAAAHIDESWSSWSKKHGNQWPSSLKQYAGIRDEHDLAELIADFNQTKRAPSTAPELHA